MTQDKTKLKTRQDKHKPVQDKTRHNKSRQDTHKKEQGKARQAKTSHKSQGNYRQDKIR